MEVVFVVLLLWSFAEHGVLSKEASNLSSIQHAISRIEEKINTLSDGIKMESRQIDHQNRGIQRAFADCKNEIGMMIARARRDSPPTTTPSDPNMSAKLDDLTRQLQVTIATLRLVNSDLATLKKSVSEVANTTNAIWDKIDTGANIQELFKSPQEQRPVQLPPTTSAFVTGHPKNCREVQQQSTNAPSGIYLVQPDSSQPPFMVLCDMVIQNGGWLTIHSRHEGNQDFDLGWQDYKNGFGNIAGEHWLGLEKIYQLTGNNINEILIETVDDKKVRSFAHYTYFSIGSEEEGYSLKVLADYRGNAGDALSYQAGSKFSTKDKDQDSWREGSCAQSHSGAWWYKACDKSNLNGRYIPGPQPDQFLYQAMYWGNPQAGLVEARMLIRPRENTNAMFVPSAV